MKKSELKTGMRVKLRNGMLYIVLIGDYKTKIYGVQDFVIASDGGFMDGSSFDDNLKASSGNSEWDIVEVYDSSCWHNANQMLSPTVKGNLLWERKEKSEIDFDKLIEEAGRDISKILTERFKDIIESGK